MTYDEIEKLESLSAEQTGSHKQLNNLLVEEYLDNEERKKNASQNSFFFFYEDVISTRLLYNFESALGEIPYKSASEDAKSCLQISTDFKKLNGYSASTWLGSALKFADNIVLHYIQEVCKKSPEKYGDAGVEKSRYIQLSKMVGDVARCGAMLKDLYEMRNRFEHRTITKPDGTHELVTPSRSKLRKDVGKLYPLVLSNFLASYKKELPFYVQSKV